MLEWNLVCVVQGKTVQSEHQVVCLPSSETHSTAVTTASHWVGLVSVWNFLAWRPGWPGTCWDPPASAYQVLGFQAYTPAWVGFAWLLFCFVSSLDVLSSQTTRAENEGD